MFQRSEHLGHGGGSVALRFQRPVPALPLPALGSRFAEIDLVPDLGANIGSATWFRGFATLGALCAATIALSPDTDHRLIGATPAALTGSEWDEAHAQTLAPLALGADTGRRMAANDLVVPLAGTPERPILELSATLGQGDGFRRVLERAGVGGAEAAIATDLVADAIAVDAIPAGTRIALTLGRRADRSVARPLESLSFRAAFDLALAIERVDGRLVLRRIPIAVDQTPLRIRGRVGSSLYRAARASGAPARVVEAYLRLVSQRTDIGNIDADANFDIVIEHERAATGEARSGNLLYAGLDQGTRRMQLVRWEQDGRTQWFEASGVGETKGALAAPVIGRQTSGFGLRRHPLLNYTRFHKGIDFGAAYGSPIHAVTDGTITYSGWHGGHGKYVQINHGSGLSTAYGHMSRIVAASGQRVRRGDVIGYVGSTGISTGPHLHYELWKNGVAINPRSLSFTTRAQLSGSELQRFRATVSRFMGLRSGAVAAEKPAMVAAR